MPERKPARRPDPDDADDAGFDLVEEPPAPKPAKPKRRKKLRRRIPAAEDDSHEVALRHYEWVTPSIVLGVGAILTLVGAFGVAGKAAVLHTLGVLVVGLLVSVPLTIAALMVGGALLGIEYGRFGPAVLKIAAITLVSTGVLWVGDRVKVPEMLSVAVSCVITFGLFMMMFDLDTWETNMSLGMVNALTFVAHLVIAMFLVVGEAKSDRKRDRGGDHAPAGMHHDPDDDHDPDR